MHVTAPSRAVTQLAVRGHEAAAASLGECQVGGVVGRRVAAQFPDPVGQLVFDVFQIPYSAVQRDHEELITEAADAGAGTFIRGGAARGAASEDKNWQTGPLSQDPGVGQRNWETSGIAGLLSEAGMSNMEFVLRFTLSHPGLSTTIVGTSNPAHLASNIAIAEKGPLPADLYDEAKKRLPLP